MFRSNPWTTVIRNRFRKSISKFEAPQIRTDAISDLLFRKKTQDTTEETADEDTTDAD